MYRFVAFLIMIFVINNCLIAQLLYRQIDSDDARRDYKIPLDSLFPNITSTKVAILVVRKDVNVNSQLPESNYVESAVEFFKQIPSFDVAKLSVYVYDFSGESVDSEKFLKFQSQTISIGELTGSEFYIITSNEEVVNAIDKYKKELSLIKSSISFPKSHIFPVAFQYDSKNLRRQDTKILNSISVESAETIFRYELNLVIDFLSELEISEKNEEGFKYLFESEISQPFYSNSGISNIQNWNSAISERVSFSTAAKLNVDVMDENNLELFVGIGFENLKLSLESNTFNFSNSLSLPVELEDYNGSLQVSGQEVIESLNFKRMTIIHLPIILRVLIDKTGWVISPEITMSAVLPSIANSTLNSGSFSYYAMLDDFNDEIHNIDELELSDNVSFVNYNPKSIRYFGYGINTSVSVSRMINQNSCLFTNINFSLINLKSDLDGVDSFSTELYDYNSLLNSNGVSIMSLNLGLGYRIFIR